MSVAYYPVCQDVVYKVVTWYGVTNRVLMDPFMAKMFVKYKHTPTKNEMKGRPVGGPALKAGLGRGPLVPPPLGDHRDPVVCWTKPFGEHVQVPFRLSKRARRESGVSAVWPGMLQCVSQLVLFAGPVSTNVHCCPICEVKEAPSLHPSHSGRALLWTREPLEGKSTSCTTRLRALPQTLLISFDTCCLDPRSDVSASYQPQVPMTPLV